MLLKGVQQNRARSVGILPACPVLLGILSEFQEPGNKYGKGRRIMSPIDLADILAVLHCPMPGNLTAADSAGKDGPVRCDEEGERHAS